MTIIPEDLEISIDKPYREFKSHICREENIRILFSGPFGSGKTYFLNEFFKTEEEFKCIRIYPVNYSASQNEDIFECVKYDILFGLLELGIDFTQEEFSKQLTLQFFLINGVEKILPTFIEMSSKIGKTVLPIISGLIKLEKEFQEFHHEMNKDDQKLIESFLSSQSNKTGSIKEEDAITQIINLGIAKLKKDNPDKQIVLIIDDLDRIDPEHIFRILNVFAAHFDRDEDGNKFDLDKVILVAHEVNLRNIFKAKFGIDTDFNGYLDKFYSQKIFNFDNREKVSKTIVEILLSVKVLPSGMEEDFAINDVRNISHIVVKLLLQSMVDNHAVNLRELKRIHSTNYKLPQYLTPFAPNLGQLQCSGIKIVQVFDFLIHILGGVSDLENSLRKIESSLSNITYGSNSRDIDRVCECLIPILDIPNHRYNKNIESFEYKHPHGQITFRYRLQSIGSLGSGLHSNITKVSYDMTTKPIELDLFVMLSETFKTLKRYGLYQVPINN